MSDHSAIQWTDATWNPTTGCTKVSPGCANCYITRTPPFRIAGRRFDRSGTTGVELHPDRLDAPLSWRKPRRVFVNSLSDLFHESIDFAFIDRVFDVMARTPQHTYQILTKRAERMRDYSWLPSFVVLPHVWMGASVENRRWRSRIEILRQTRTAVRFLSCEPLLEDLGDLDLREIDLVIFGGESGINARRCEVRWILRGMGQCRQQGAAVFIKQLGRRPTAWSQPLKLRDPHGGEMSEWPEYLNSLRVREFPRTAVPA